MKKFPIGIQTFSELIEENYYYIDKTPLIAQLVEKGKYYFLSRPRRFGKSLLVSTLSAAFKGEETLFKGLYLEKNWDWSQQYPVIKISFGFGEFNSVLMLEKRFKAMLDETAASYKVNLQQQDLANRFTELIQALQHLKGQNVVVLVDEYDKPILDNIDKPEKALIMRRALNNIYSVIKGCDQYIKFVLIIGVSHFINNNIFSGLNNLQDISLNNRYATLCGYTEQEIKTVFFKYFQEIDFNKFSDWYGGYNFLGETVYNPYDVLLFLKNKQFKNYWLETDSLSFLLKLITKQQYNLPDVESIVLSEMDLKSFDIDNISLEVLLFQLGYLTIERVEELSDNYFYYLNYPNREVKASLNQYLSRVGGTDSNATF
ncbi:MAG: AAA family ATPase [Methylococcaceae bacterium]|nr:AAA family ATPase [Methylococcaceae bacterium]